MEPSASRQGRYAWVGPLKGPAISVILAMAFVLLPGWSHVDLFSAALAINSAYAALAGGLWSAVATALMSLGYLAATYFDPSQPFGFSTDDRIRLLTMAFALPASVMLVLHGKGRAELAARLQAERDSALAHARQLESEVERRLAELRLASAQQDELERFRELDRLKGLFVNAVSHELRTPLTSIVGYVEFLEDGIGGTLSPVQNDYVRQIRHSSRQLQRLVDDLLDFARFEAGTFKPDIRLADLGDKTRQVLNSLRPQIQEARLQLAVDVPQEPLPAWFDAQRIEQVMLNLLSNAIKFTPQGGSIQIRLAHQDGMAHWSVEDTGIGIDPAHHALLFHPYSRIETGLAVKGTGLGLSISKAIVEAHGGEIGVESTPSVGSRFWFQLPRQPLEQPGDLASLSPLTI